MGAPQHVFQVYIRATPERLWQAITDPAMTQIYYFNSLVESDFAAGSPITYKQPDGSLDIEGEVLEPIRHGSWSTRSPASGRRTTIRPAPSREITPMGSETCLLSLTHGGFASENATYNGTRDGWPIILSGLKTLVETGEKLKIEVPEAAEATA